MVNVFYTNIAKFFLERFIPSRVVFPEFVTNLCKISLSTITSNRKSLNLETGKSLSGLQMKMKNTLMLSVSVKTEKENTH